MSGDEEPEVDPTLVSLFGEAVAFGRAGKHAEAAVAYRAILDLQRTAQLAAIPRFLSTTHLQLGYALIDLGRVEEAEAELALVDAYSFGDPQRYDFHFTRGNVLGALGRLAPMFSAFVEAISVAEDLDDFATRPRECWTKILSFTLHAQDWAYLVEVGEKAVQVSRVRGWKDIETKALVALAEARKHHN